MTVEPADLATLRLAGSPVLAPDGTRVVAPVQTVDRTTPRYRSRLWSFRPDGPAEPVTADGADTAPAFSPAGTLAFLSNRDGRRRPFVVESGDPRALRAPDGSVTALAWLDERRLVALVEVAAEAGEPVVVEWLRYLRDGGPSFVEPAHELWLLPVDAEPSRLRALPGRVTCLATTGGTVVYAMEERHSDVPAAPTEVRRVHPDGGPDELLWRCPAPVTGLAATAASGRVVAVSSAVGGHSAVPPRVWVLEDGSARPAFPAVDLDCERAVLGDGRPLGAAALVHPVAGGDEIAFLATVGHDVAVFAGPIDGTPRRLTPEGHTVTDFSAAVGGTLAACVESPAGPVEVFLVPVAGGPLTPVSELNAPWAGVVAPTEVTVTAEDGLPLRGLLYSRQAGGPLVVRVHGGPHLCWGTAFDVENQVLAGAGYQVLAPNPRGSAGRGGGFRARSVGDWGGRDHTDLMAFTDWAVETGVADPDRLYLAGGSYGGFLVNWTVTRTDRFRAVVSERSISNFLSKLGTSDNGYTVNRHELGGADVLDDTAARLWEVSPLRYARSITTPMLLVHGEDDRRCPIEQSEQLFTALRRLGVPARFARFPGESHNLATAGRPDHRIARLDLILAWLAEHGGLDQ